MRVIVVAAVLLFSGCSNSPDTVSRSDHPSASGGPPALVDEGSAGAGGVGNDDVEEAAGAPSASLSFDDAVLPQAQLNQTYEYAFEAAGDAGPITFAAIGDSLPKGLSLSPKGVLSGTPTVAGEFTLKVNAKVHDTSVDATFQLEVIQNAWLVYRSDERTPAVNELFAVNIGQKPPYASVAVNHPLGEGEQVSQTFSWSPDGSFLAYSGAQAEKTDAYVVDMRGLAPGLPVSLNALFGRKSTGQVDLRWAPNSKALVVQDQVESLIVDFSGSQPTSRAAGKYCWKWTPDSQKLLCQEEQSVISLRLDQGPTTTLTGTLAVQYGNLTPDGTTLVFDSRAGDGLLYFSRLADAVPHPVPLNPVPVGLRTSYSWVDNGALIYVASNVSLYEHEIYRATYSNPPRIETLVTGIDTSATGMDWRDIRPQLLPGGKLLAYQSPGHETSTLELNVRELATGRETSWTVSPRSFVITSKDGTITLVPQLWQGGDLLARCKFADAGLQGCIDLNSAQLGFEIHDAALSPTNDGALFMGAVSGQPHTAFYADMRGDIRQAVPLHNDGDAVTTIASTAFGPDGHKLFLRLKSSNNTSLFLIDLRGQRPSAPQLLSGKGLVTWAAWQPSQVAL